jgi:FAD/FMN-containing dehydrogenase
MITSAPTPTVLRRGDAGWDSARAAFNVLIDQQPDAIAVPANEREIAAAISYARGRGLRVAPQATGHNAGPLGALDDALILNTSSLTGVSIDADARRVRVGAATRWEDVVPRLSELGLAALHGSSPDVGIVGYSLGGGVGWLARKHWMQANAVTAIELVTADGHLVRTDRVHEPELFWALRGGGGNFGVVTAIEFEVQPVSELYAGAMFFGLDQGADVLHAWTELLPELPDDLTSWANFMHFPPDPALPGELRGRSFVVVNAAFLGSEADGRELLRPVSGTRSSTACPPRRSRTSPGSPAPARRLRSSSCATWAAPCNGRPPRRERVRRCPARSACSPSASCRRRARRRW